MLQRSSRQRSAANVPPFRETRETQSLAGRPDPDGRCKSGESSPGDGQGPTDHRSQPAAQAARPAAGFVRSPHEVARTSALEIDAPAGAEARTDHCGRPSYRRKNSRVTELLHRSKFFLTRDRSRAILLWCGAPMPAPLIFQALPESNPHEIHDQCRPARTEPHARFGADHRPQDH